MQEVWTFKCPSCGNALEYVPGTMSLQCPFCSHTVTEEEIRSLGEQAEAAAPSGEGMRSYHCQNCGAEIVTGETTAATRCYYCHSPVVLTDRLSHAVQPDGVIPFSKSRESAVEEFKTYLSKKHFLDKRFLSDDQLEMISGVYYPYFLGDFEGTGSFTGEGTRVSSFTRGQTIYTTTKYYRVLRKGKLQFSNMQRSALRAADRKLSDGIHPYRLQAMVPFSMAYLSGFLAEMRDIPPEEAEQEMNTEIQGYVPDLMKRNHTFQSLKGTASYIQEKSRLRYVLLPVWVLTYKGRTPDKPYYFLMNGQLGTVCGRLPLNRKKLLSCSALVGLVVAGLLCLGGALLW
ncbi:MAG: TFIIB-type zinc ribbon-containing protein [Clostridia bacterium]|nr:TFIIB-type zinc ribbon-containing protein [Clostridia bacterium]